MTAEQEQILRLEQGLAGIADPVERAGQFARLREALQACWALGRDIVLAWRPVPGGIELLRVPYYILVAGAEAPVLQDMLAPVKMAGAARMEELAARFERKPELIAFDIISAWDLGLEAIESMVRPYGLTYSEDRAVALFDIVGFSLYSPLEQMAQLSSLAYSINQAHAMLSRRSVKVHFARSTTGDGYYIWNRDDTVDANINLYHLVHLVLADNALASRHAAPGLRVVPRLRTCFHIGGHYELHHAEALAPGASSYIVGEVTIELARLSVKARPGQILVGDFRERMLDAAGGDEVVVDTVGFIQRAEASLGRLRGIRLSDEEVRLIKCYLTGNKNGEGGFHVDSYRVPDKHGKWHVAYNAKVNLYPGEGPPIFLGLQNRDLGEFLAGLESG